MNFPVDRRPSREVKLCVLEKRVLLGVVLVVGLTLVMAVSEITAKRGRQESDDIPRRQAHKIYGSAAAYYVVGLCWILFIVTGYRCRRTVLHNALSVCNMQYRHAIQLLLAGERIDLKRSIDFNRSYQFVSAALSRGVLLGAVYATGAGVVAVSGRPFVA